MWIIAFAYLCIFWNVDLFPLFSQDLLQSVLVKEVFSHSTGRFRRSDAGETANVVAQLLDGVMAVDEEVLLEEVTQLQEKLDE